MNIVNLLNDNVYLFNYAVNAKSIQEATDKLNTHITDTINLAGTPETCFTVKQISGPFYPKVQVMSKLKLMDLFDIKDLEGTENVAIVSIRSAISTPANVKTKGPVLSIVFDDVEKDTGTVAPQIAITQKQAKAIALFLYQISNNPDIKLLICQCDAGISRSAGVAAAFMEWSVCHNSKSIFASPRFIPNMLVFNSVFKELCKVSTYNQEDIDGSEEKEKT